MSSEIAIAELIESAPEVRQGRPCVKGTGITVHRIATWHNLGASAETIAVQIPHLTLARVHAALAHYFANQTRIDAEIAADLEQAEEIEQELIRAAQLAS